MKGKDLISWIKKHNAEDLDVIVLHRDEGGYYHTAEHLGDDNLPMLCKYSNEIWGTIRNVDFSSDNPNAVAI